MADEGCGKNSVGVDWIAGQWCEGIAALSAPDRDLAAKDTRVSQGTSIQSGVLPHTSTNPPGPLTALEEAILIVSTGVDRHDEA